jgi:hypothetical protein
MPLPTFEKLISLARDGATILFEGQLPQDVPGWRELERRRGILKKLQEGWTWTDSAAGKLKTLQPGKGSLLVGEWETVLEQAKVIRESLTDRPGLFCIRRAFSGGRHYFIANRGEQVVNGWLPLSLAAKSVIILDPMSGKTGVAAIRPKQSDTTEVYLQLQPGEAIILRVFSDRNIRGTRWPYSGSLGNSIELKGTWNVEFLQGGPNLPAAYETAKLVSWTQSSSEAESFAGTARYRLHFEAPSQAGDSWILDLGKVCQSARVRLNGQDLGISYTPPYRVAAVKLRRGSNLLEVEVTNVAANRIRDLDRRKVNWKIFNDINFVNIDYKPFDASGWPLTDAGLLGPVTITPCKAFALGSK